MVVEHDEATMQTADWIIDLVPGPGVLGGHLVAAGTPEEIQENPDSFNRHNIFPKPYKLCPQMAENGASLPAGLRSKKPACTT